MRDGCGYLRGQRLHALDGAQQQRAQRGAGVGRRGPRAHAARYEAHVRDAHRLRCALAGQVLLRISQRCIQSTRDREYGRRRARVRLGGYLAEVEDVRRQGRVRVHEPALQVVEREARGALVRLALQHAAQLARHLRDQRLALPGGHRERAQRADTLQRHSRSTHRNITRILSKV